VALYRKKLPYQYPNGIAVTGVDPQEHMILEKDTTGFRIEMGTFGKNCALKKVIE
jgi:hypothetical protein